MRRVKIILFLAYASLLRAEVESFTGRLETEGRTREVVITVSSENKQGMRRFWLRDLNGKVLSEQLPVHALNQFFRQIKPSASSTTELLAPHGTSGGFKQATFQDFVLKKEPGKKSLTVLATATYVHRDIDSETIDRKTAAVPIDEVIALPANSKIVQDFPVGIDLGEGVFPVVVLNEKMLKNNRGKEEKWLAVAPKADWNAKQNSRVDVYVVPAASLLYSFNSPKRSARASQTKPNSPEQEQKQNTKDPAPKDTIARIMHGHLTFTSRAPIPQAEFRKKVQEQLEKTPLTNEGILGVIRQHETQKRSANFDAKRKQAKADEVTREHAAIDQAFSDYDAVNFDEGLRDPNDNEFYLKEGRGPGFIEPSLSEIHPMIREMERSAPIEERERLIELVRTARDFAHLATHDDKNVIAVQRFIRDHLQILEDKPLALEEVRELIAKVSSGTTDYTLNHDLIRGIGKLALARARTGADIADIAMFMPTQAMKDEFIKTNMGQFFVKKPTKAFIFGVDGLLHDFETKSSFRSAAMHYISRSEKLDPGIVTHFLFFELDDLERHLADQYTEARANPELVGRRLLAPTSRGPENYATIQNRLDRFAQAKEYLKNSLNLLDQAEPTAYHINYFVAVANSAIGPEFADKAFQKLISHIQTAEAFFILKLPPGMTEASRQKVAEKRREIGANFKGLDWCKFAARAFFKRH